MAAVREALADVSRVVVVERALSPGVGGPLTSDVRAAVASLPTEIVTVVAGLGGRAVTRPSLRGALLDANRGALEPLTFLDLDLAQVERAKLTGAGR
jgi:pyruvate ferredoxin oxidoreductase alpha subunit